MSVAKQVPAKNLCQKMGRETLAKVLNSEASALFTTVPANGDTFVPRLVVRYPSSTLALGPGTSHMLVMDAPGIVARLLKLTPYQQTILEREATSITANDYKRVGGSDALLAMSSLRHATVMLHAIGFSRVCEDGAICNPRFIKALEVESGGHAVASAVVESTKNTTYVNVSVESVA